MSAFVLPVPRCTAGRLMGENVMLDNPDRKITDAGAGWHPGPSRRNLDATISLGGGIARAQEDRFDG